MEKTTKIADRLLDLQKKWDEFDDPNKPQFNQVFVMLADELRKIDQCPENCKLFAIWTGDGWSLEVHDRNDECVAILDWPTHWKRMNESRLIRAGFEIG